MARNPLMPPDECGEQSPENFVCTLTPGHAGPHKAHDAKGEVVDEWSDTPTRTLTLTMKYPVSDQLLSDILTTAIEGGVNYWLLSAHSVKRTEQGDPLVVVGPLDITEDEPLAKDIDFDTLQRGIRLVMQADVVPRRDDIRSALLRALVSEDAGGIDAEAADIIVQAGLFGELVYG